MLAIDLFANGARLAEIEQAVALTPDYPLEGLLIQLIEDDKRFSDEEMAHLHILTILRETSPRFMNSFRQLMLEAGFKYEPEIIVQLAANARRYSRKRTANYACTGAYVNVCAVI